MEINKIAYRARDTMKIFGWSVYARLKMQRFFFDNLLLILLQFSGCSFTLSTQTDLPISFMIGSACGFLFLKGIRIIPGIWLGTFFGYFLFINAETGYVLASLISVQSFMLVWISYQLNLPLPIFSNHKKYLAYVTVCIALSTFHTLLLSNNKEIAFLIYPNHNLLQYFFINLNTLLIFPPLIATWDYYFPEFHGTFWKKIYLIRFMLITFLMMIILSILLKSSVIFWLLNLILLLFVMSCSYKYGWIPAIGLNGLLVFFLSLAAYIFEIKLPIIYLYAMPIFAFFCTNLSFKKIIS